MDLRWMAFGLVVAFSPLCSSPAAADELSVLSVRPLPLDVELANGTVEHHELGLDGLVVRGAFETIWRAPDGGERVLAARHPTELAQAFPGDERISADELPDRVAEALGLVDPPAFDGPPKLVYHVILGRPVLSWEVDLPLSLAPEPSRKTLWLGAMSGRLLAELDNVRSSRARVFPENPSSSPEGIEVELPGLNIDGGGQVLSGERIRAFNCIVTEPLDPADVVEWREDDDCYPIQRLLSDGNGDFFVPLPDITHVEQNLDGDDLYAELSLYYHAERFLAAMRDLGIESFRCEQASMIANFRFLEPSPSYPTLPWAPLQQAFYTDECDFDKGPTMVFGQTSAVDTAWDGDLVYHELGHGIVRMLSAEGLYQSRLRPDASVVDAAAINEGIADYLSASLAGDPFLADYIGRYWAGMDTAYVRSAKTKKRCPDNLEGESHNDGEPLVAALWAARTRVGEVVDTMVLRSLMRMPADVDLEQGSWIMLEVADELVNEGKLDDFGRDVVFRSLDARGLLDCPRVVTDPVQVSRKRVLYLRRKTDAVEPFFPGPLQLRHVVAEDSDNVLVSFEIRPRGTGSVEARLLVKRDDAPIEFTYELVALDQPNEPEVRELVVVDGDWDLELTDTELNGPQRQVLVRGLLPGEVVHLMLVNSASTSAHVTRFYVTSIPSDEVDHGSAGGGGGQDGSSWHGDESASCACRAPVDPPGPSPIWGLVWLTWARRREP